MFGFWVLFLGVFGGSWECVVVGCGGGGGEDFGCSGGCGRLGGDCMVGVVVVVCGCVWGGLFWLSGKRFCVVGYLIEGSF